MMSFNENVIKVIKSIPYGKVISYGQVAALAGNNRAARQVSWILKNNSDKENLPWHRVVSSKRTISLPIHSGGIIQKGLLENEGVKFKKKGTEIEKIFFWNGS
ncbi:MAG: methylated-DNA--[protein]-cysteine S-methyltransferase [Spirochaetaceae bacterium]|jgi:methylated-DNA-protein-cysteine methyltransferase-like protein|nr:methylated-DNA--[protein]-cysteine S-methyltransferase [Spirochaetaceae bacterium]